MENILEYYSIEKLLHDIRSKKVSYSQSVVNYYNLIEQPETIKDTWSTAGTIIREVNYLSNDIAQIENPFICLKGLSVHFFTPTLDRLFLDIKEQNLIYNNVCVKDINELIEPLKDYKQGFLKGYYDFDKELNTKLTVFKTSDLAIKKILDYIEINKRDKGRLSFELPKPKPPYFNTSKIVIGKNKDGQPCKKIIEEKRHFIVPQKKWFDNGYKTGMYYKAWYNVLSLYEIFDSYLQSQTDNTTNGKAIAGFKSGLTDKQIEYLYNAMNNNYFETSLKSFNAFLHGGNLVGVIIKWIDKSDTRHDPNKQTLFEFLYLLKKYEYLTKDNFDTTSSNPNNLYRKLETVFTDIKYFAQSNPTCVQGKTPRQKELETIIQNLKS
jgi:hypothetical protein